MQGPAPAKRKVTFSCVAPAAQTVLLAGCFTNWDQEPIKLNRQKSGLWKTTISLASGTYRYRFLVDGEWQDDPARNQRESNSYGTQNCVINVA
jgi:1,4-alpha-glucan branching enzyme